MLIFTVYQPLLTEINDRGSQIDSQESTLREREEFLRTVDRKTAALQVQQEHESRLATMLPTRERMEDALRILHQSSQVAGVTIDTIINNSTSLQAQLNSKRARGDIVELPASIVPLGANIRFAGTYQQLRAFVAELEKTPRLMDIKNILITRNQTAPDQVSGEMLIQFYMQDDKVAL